MILGKAAIYTNSLSGDDDRQQLLAKFGNRYEIVAEYSDDGPGTSGFEKLLADAAKGEFKMLLCTDLSRIPGDEDDDEKYEDKVTLLQQAGLQVDTLNMKSANVKFYRIHRQSMVVVELIVTLEAEESEAEHVIVGRAMAEIKQVLPHDDLFKGAWREEEELVEWLDW